MGGGTRAVSLPWRKTGGFGESPPQDHLTLPSLPPGEVYKLHAEIPLHSGLPAGGEAGLCQFHPCFTCSHCSQGVPSGPSFACADMGTWKGVGRSASLVRGQEAGAQVCPEQQASLRSAPEACDPVAQACILPTLSSAVLSLSAPLCPFCYPVHLPQPLIPAVCLPTHRLSPPAWPHFQDTPRKSCVYRSGYSFSRGCSYTCAKKIQVCPEPPPLSLGPEKRRWEWGSRGGTPIRFQRGWELG